MTWRVTHQDGKGVGMSGHREASVSDHRPLHMNEEAAMGQTQDQFSSHKNMYTWWGWPSGCIGFGT